MTFGPLPKALIAILAAATALSPVAAASTVQSGFDLRLSVPVICTLSHRADVASAGGGFRLGELMEYCNAPGGYSVTVSYAPGTMRGARLALGDESVLLDGSGTAVISRAPGPRIRDRAVFAEAGPDGFDTDRLDFAITQY